MKRYFYLWYGVVVFALCLLWAYKLHLRHAPVGIQGFMVVAAAAVLCLVSADMRSEGRYERIFFRCYLVALCAVNLAVLLLRA